MSSVLNTVLKQMDYFNQYKYPGSKSTKVYPYTEEEVTVDFSAINSEDVYAYYSGSDFHIQYSDDNYDYHVVVANKFVV